MNRSRVLIAGACFALAACAQTSTTPSGVATAPDRTVTLSSPSPSTSASSNPGDSPAKAVTAYFAALVDRRCDEAFGLLTDPLRTTIGSASSLCNSSDATSNRSFSVGTVTGGESDQASVAISVVKSDGSAHQATATVVTVNGSWRLSNLTVGGATTATPAAGQVSAESISNTIQNQYASQTGGATISLSCPRTGVFPSTPGDSYRCTFTDRNGRTGSLTVSITSAHGDFTWTIG